MSKKCLRNEPDWWVRFAFRDKTEHAQGDELIYAYDNSATFGRDDAVIIVIGSPDPAEEQPFVELRDNATAYIVSGQPNITRIGKNTTVVQVPTHPGFAGADYIDTVPASTWTARKQSFARTRKTLATVINCARSWKRRTA